MHIFIHNTDTITHCYLIIRRLTKEIYDVYFGGNAGRGRSRRTFLARIARQVLEKVQVKSTRNWRACMRNLMKEEEVKSACKDRSKRKEVISANPNGK
jgi:hypothetical protein